MWVKLYLPVVYFGRLTECSITILFHKYIYYYNPPINGCPPVRALLGHMGDLNEHSSKAPPSSKFNISKNIIDIFDCKFGIYIHEFPYVYSHFLSIDTFPNGVMVIVKLVPLMGQVKETQMDTLK